MNFLKKIVYGLRVRTLKIDILTLFMSLTFITFIFVMGYSFIKNYKAILEYSKGRMERNSALIIERVNNLEEDAEQILQTSAVMFPDYQQYSVDDKKLWNYMVNILKFYPYTSSMFFGYPSGNLILVRSMLGSTLTNFINDPSKPLPADTSFIIRVVDMKKNPPETWYYTDSTLKILGSENISGSTDIKTRPWYTTALQAPGIHWTPVYNFFKTKDYGTAASQAVYNQQNKLIGIAGAETSLTALASFLNNQKIGTSGRTLIINEDGNVITPELQTFTNQKISPEVIQEVIQHFLDTKDHNFSIKVDRVRYLSYISNTPAKFNKQWMVVTIVPFWDMFADLIKAQFEVILFTLLILVFSIVVIFYFSKRISKPIVELSQEIDKITNLNLDSEKRVVSYIIEIRAMDTSVASLRAALRSFSRYVPKEIVQQLLAQGKEIALHVDKKRLTIFFSDIKDFTTIAETTSLRTLMPLLNKYFDGLSKIILHNQGTIDKYIGDSVMAIWGAPTETTQHATLACIAALKCQAFVIEFNRECRRQGDPEFVTRFGISSGMVVVGNIGTLERMNYTVIGDAVNTAARLQVTDKIYHVNIIISEKVYKQTDGRFLVRPLDTVEVKGRKAKIKIYELVALLDDDPVIGATARQTELCTLFTEAYQQFVQGNYTEAQEQFRAIFRKFPEDYPTEFYLNRLAELLSPPLKKGD